VVGIRDKHRWMRQEGRVNEKGGGKIGEGVWKVGRTVDEIGEGNYVDENGELQR
jgi:hypothetical protein